VRTENRMRALHFEDLYLASPQCVKLCLRWQRDHRTRLGRPWPHVRNSIRLCRHPLAHVSCAMIQGAGLPGFFVAARVNRNVPVAIDH